jgi:small multidrug resistance pump
MSSSFVSYGSLLLAIISEIVGTTFLKKSEQFTLVIPTLVSLACYAIAFYFLSISLKTIPVGIAYALWSGVGIVLISIIGVVMFKQHLDFWAIAGLILIVVGVVVVNLSKSITH